MLPPGYSIVPSKKVGQFGLALYIYIISICLYIMKISHTKKDKDKVLLRRYTVFTQKEKKLIQEDNCFS